jgi:hypothetical protein
VCAYSRTKNSLLVNRWISKRGTTRPVLLSLLRGLQIDCSDYKCSHLITMSGDHWPDEMRISDFERRFVCSACGKRGADVRSNFNLNKPTVAMMGYRRCKP